MKKGLSLVIVLLLAGMLSSVFLPGCAEKQEIIKIYLSTPMQDVAGPESVNGVKLALEEADYQAGGYDIELIFEDDGDETGVGQYDIEAEVAKRAVADEDVMIFLGPLDSGAAKASIPITNVAGMAQISPSTTWPGLTLPGFLPGEPGIFYPTGNRNFFRVAPTDLLQGPAGAVWAKELGVENVYIFDDGDSFGKGVADIFEQKAIEIGLNVVGHQTLDGAKKDFTTELIPLEDLDIDLIYFGGTALSGGISLAMSIKEAGLNAKFMGPDGLTVSSFITQSNGAAEGTYITTFGVPSNKLSELTEKGDEFYNNYKEKYGEPSVWSAFTYEAAKVALLAIERAGVKDRAKILDEVSKIENYEGIFGKWSFDENGDTTLFLISGLIVKDGELVFDKILKAK